MRKVAVIMTIFLLAIASPMIVSAAKNKTTTNVLKKQTIVSKQAEGKIYKLTIKKAGWLPSKSETYETTKKIYNAVDMTKNYDFTVTTTVYAKDGRVEVEITDYKKVR